MKLLLKIFLLVQLAGCRTAMKEPAKSSNEIQPGHHAASGFRNPPGEREPPASASHGTGFYLRRLRRSFFRPDIPPGHVVPEQDALRTLDDLKEHNTLTWLGHSTFLLRLDGKTILTDPFLTANAFPLSRGGPRRHAPPGIQITNLPAIDILVLSHDHLDHLDPKTLRALPHKEKIAVFVPLGLKRFVEKCGYAAVHELDWRQSAAVGGLTFTALPAVHNSGRGPNNRNKTLWCSWAIRSAAANLFFAGDTAYSPVAFKEIGAARGPFDAALVPIGAYEPRNLMRAYHANPEEAVRIGLELEARTLVAMHWGTIELSDEPFGNPPRRFRKKAAASGYAEDRIWTMKIGETRVLP